MNELDQTLYYILLENKDRFLTQEEVWRKLYPYMYPPNNFHDTNERQLLTRQINRLNRSYDFEGIILSTSKGIKLATEIEAIKQLKSIYAMACKKLKYAREIEKKINRDGQFDLDLNEYHSFLRKDNGNE